MPTKLAACPIGEEPLLKNAGDELATRAQLHANVHNVRVDERSVEATDAGVDKLAHHVGFGERLRPLALRCSGVFEDAASGRAKSVDRCLLS